MQIATDIASLTCICCPLGCEVEVSFDEQGGVADIAGHSCKRGAKYAANEAVRPERTITAVLPVAGCLEPVSVKTAGAVPKVLVRDVLRAIAGLRLEAPVHAGQRLLGDVCGTGVDVVATKSVF